MEENKIAHANEAYLQGDFAEAAKSFDELLSNNTGNPYLLINSANAHFQVQDYGQSILYLYKAKAKIPRNKELNNNLGIILDELQLTQPAMLSYSSINIFEAFIFLLVFNILFLFRKKLSTRKSLRFLISFIFCLSLSAFSFIAFEQKVQQHAVVTQAVAAVYSGDNEEYKQLAELSDGQIIEIIRREKTWSKIRFNKSIAWIKNSNFKVI